MSIQSTLFVIFLTTLFATQSLAQSLIPTEPHLYYSICNSSYGNYTANSFYAANLQTVLTTLQIQSSVYPFYNTSAGSVSGSVYGQYYCRFDANTSLCSACISHASHTILTNCPNHQSAVIWYNVCTLHYSNESMFGVLYNRNGTGTRSRSLANMTDPASFSVIFNSTLDTLVKEAAYGNDVRKFAVSKVAVSTLETTYFLVQCSPDLSAGDCDTCISATYKHIERCCGNWPVEASVLFPSCQMRYNNILFYTEPPLPPPPNQLAPPPSLTTSSPDGTKKASSEKVKAGLAVTIFLAILTLQL